MWTVLHEEYFLSNPNGYGYAKFVELRNAWAERLRVTMRQVHKAGDKCFVDYSGTKLAIVDRSTGERVEVEPFVAVMGALNHTYAATASQRSADWIASHVRLIESRRRARCWSARSPPCCPRRAARADQRRCTSRMLPSTSIAR